MGTWDPNSNPHACMARKLPADPSPHLFLTIFLKAICNWIIALTTTFFVTWKKNTMTKRNLRKSLFEFKVLEG